jgi:hypothetical protein
MFFFQMFHKIALACVLFIIAFSIAPQVDVPETPLDEANTPVNEMVIEKTGSAEPNRPLMPDFVPRIFVQPNIDVDSTLPIFPDRLADSRTVRELLCTFLC